MNTMAKPTWSGKQYRRAANPIRKIGIAAASILFASLTGQAFAAPTCSAYIPAINRALASYLAAVGPRAMKNVSLDEFGNMVDPIWGRAASTPSRRVAIGENPHIKCGKDFPGAFDSSS